MSMKSSWSHKVSSCSIQIAVRHGFWCPAYCEDVPLLHCILYEVTLETLGKPSILLTDSCWMSVFLWPFLGASGACGCFKLTWIFAAHFGHLSGSAVFDYFGSCASQDSSTTWGLWVQSFGQVSDLMFRSFETWEKDGWTVNKDGWRGECYWNLLVLVTQG